MVRIVAVASLVIATISWSVLSEASGSPEPLRAATEDVSIPADGMTLAGTLYLPERTGSVPGLVLVHGSGPQPRNSPVAGQLSMQFGFTIQVFKEIALALRDSGVAVLVYDKRTCTSHNGCAQNSYPKPDETVTIYDFANDAVSALRFMASHEAVDASRVYVAGHSQGGQLVPEIVTQMPELAGGIILAGNLSSIDVLLKHQSEFTRAVLLDVGMAVNQIDETVAPFEKMADQVAEIRAGTHDGSPVGGVPAQFWQSWIDLSIAIPSQVQHSRVPLHVIAGEYDWNVPETELGYWKELLDSRPDGGARSATRLLPCVTHALNCVEQPDWKSIQPADIGRTVSQTVIDTIDEFIHNTSLAE